MGMDAQISSAFATLAKKSLPELHAKLAQLAKKPASGREPDDELIALLEAAREHISILEGWANPATTQNEDLTPGDDSSLDASASLDMSDEEASALLQSAESTAAPADLDDQDAEAAAMLEAMNAPADLGQVAATVRDALPASDGEHDPDALAMLAAMEGAQVASAAPPTGDMSDAEARAMLAAMDAPLTPEPASGDMSDAEARAMLEAMDAPASAAGGDMSDAEARAMLEAMDAPATAAGGDMSDAEARAMLAAMDAPVAAAPKLTVAPVPAAAMSAEEEALALLASMGGAEEDEGSNAPAAPAQPPSHDASDHDSDGDSEHLEEIDEFAKNDFASDPDMLNDFVTNAAEIMETLDEKVLQLEQNPRDKETIESIFRAAHTLKGAGGMFGFKAVERVMHRMENLFDLVRKGTLIPDSNLIDVLFQGLDVLRTLLDAVKNGKPSGIPTVPICKSLELAIKGRYVKGSSPAAAAKAPPPERAVAASASAPAAGHDGGGEEKPAKKKNVEQSTIRVDLERLDALVNLVGELVIDRTRFATIEEDIRTTSPQLKVAGNMTETVQLFGRHMNEIHEIIMKIRMVPIGNAFNKFTRIVRDLGRQLDKEMELYIEGEATELDKTLVEQISDPLIHLIRNSCDHGIELPQVREAAGKKRSGLISLSARQEGNNIIITIQDDGKGLPADIIRRKAIEKGLITDDMVLSKRDTFNLIFEPGFSTAEKITNISGRGVGMDVVRKQISKLKGIIDLDSEPGKGTTTTIRLPLTLAIMQSLLIESQGEVFAVPLSTVVESVRIKPNEVQFVGDAEVIKRHDKVLPLMHLHDTLDLGRKSQSSWYSAKPQTEEMNRVAAMRLARRKDRLYVVIVGSGDRRFGIVVDQLLSQQEMVIKSLGPVMKKIPSVAGGAVLGNGEVVLVLDIQELEDRFRSRARSKVA